MYAMSLGSDALAATKFHVLTNVNRPGPPSPGQCDHDEMESLAQGPVPRYAASPDRAILSRSPRANLEIGIRNFVVQYILQISGSEESLKAQRTLLNKLNLVLISVLKQEWPHNWPTFINEIISACRTSLSICENNMIILGLLSEEVFDYSADQMTSAKTRNLKTVMCAEFSQIFQLCQEILNTADQPSLVKATLETLLRFCNWIPLGYIFETPLIETLRTRFLEVPEFRNVTLQCLTEIGGLQTGGVNTYDEQLVKMFTEVLTTISNFIPLSLDLKTTYPQSNSRDQEFIQNLALFLCNFFGMHLNVGPPHLLLPLPPFLFSSRSLLPPYLLVVLLFKPVSSYSVLENAEQLLTDRTMAAH